MKVLLQLSLLVFALLCAHTLYAQQTPTGDSLDYFPYRAGDTWRVRNADTHQEIDSVPVLRDSIDGSGNLYLDIDTIWVKVDTTGDVVVGPFDLHPERLYRLRAKEGERWKLVDDTAYNGYATCAAIYPENVFGEIRMVKEIHYWVDLSKEGRTDSMWYSTRWLARGLGEIRQFYDPDALHYVSGARIGNRTYGDMMLGAAAHSPLAPSPLRVTPNPFTNGATLRYHLDTRQHVRLSFADALGRIVAIPVDDTQDAGEHSTHINGEGLPDGTYFYQLRTASHTYSGTLIRQR